MLSIKWSFVLIGNGVFKSFIYFRSCNGNFHFRLVYPELKGYNEWTQTNNPTTQTVVTGLKSILFLYFRFRM